ncbi:terminase family protein [Rhodopseudomonas palustris]|uniref:DNA-packaging protein n=1 Tax=Rhodopseudomonas palustris TaxID=1076 RepID=UPI002ACE4FAC|nr:terminase family protein [Rhodopseudomonas palustris]WQH00161.1 terminase family protein [Rhodopseudomonas palustris]
MTDAFLRQAGTRTLARLQHDFATFAHPHQEHGEVGNNGGPWTTWLLLGGRGAGKTRTGAEWVRALAHGTPPYAERPHRRIALIGESWQDAREVMVEGESGLLRCSPRAERPEWIASRRRLEWRNGAVGQVFSADDPESLRGPQFDAAWCDELAKWRYAEACFDTLQFGLRLGLQPRQLVTTTPRPLPLIKRLLTDPRTRVTRAPTKANADHLSPAFLDAVVGRYAGTRMGRQELDGDLIEDRADALWSRALIETCRVAQPPGLARVVVAIDPPGTSKVGADACGIVAVGRSDSGAYYVLEDASAAGLSPAAWAAKAVALYHRLDADTLIAEVNMGGEMVRAVLRETDGAVPLKEVRASRGKYVRAEPVAALYEQGKVKHVGCFPLLEDEMCDFGIDGLSSGRSPDRLDALVWAITGLMNGRNAGGPRIRQL